MIVRDRLEATIEPAAHVSSATCKQVAPVHSEIVVDPRRKLSQLKKNQSNQSHLELRSFAETADFKELIAYINLHSNDELKSIHPRSRDIWHNYQHDCYGLFHSLLRNQNLSSLEKINIIQHLAPLHYTDLFFHYPVTAIDVIQKLFDQCKSQDETLELYCTCSIFINLHKKDFKNFDTYINKMAKLKILSLMADATKEAKDDKAVAIQPLHAEQTDIENFLSNRRPSAFQFFTQKMSSSSMETLLKIRENKLPEAKSEIAAKKIKNNLKIKKELDALPRNSR